MSDDPEQNPPPKRPLSDRETEASAFKRRQAEAEQETPARQPMDWETEARAFKNRKHDEDAEDVEDKPFKFTVWDTIARAFQRKSDDGADNESPRKVSDRTTVARAFKDRVFDPEEEESPLVIEPESASDAGPKGRDLSHGSFMPPPPDDLPEVTLEGDSLLERFVPKLVGSLLIFIVAGLITYFVISNDMLSTTETDKDQETKTILDLMTESSRSSAIRADAETNPGIAIAAENTISLGGFDRLKRLSSVSMRGIINKDGRILNFSLYGMRPNYYRLVFELGDDQYIIGFNGETAWEEYKRDGVSLRSDTLSEDDTFLLRLMADYDLPPQKYLMSSDYSVQEKLPVMEINYLPRDFIAQEMYDVIRIKEEDRPNIIAYIGASDNYLHQTVMTHEGKEYRMVYDDYKKIDGAYFPKVREQYIDNQLVAKIIIEEVEFNPGMLLNIFSPPNSGQKRN